MCPYPERDGGESRLEQSQSNAVSLPADELRRLYRRLDELEALAQVARVASQSLETEQVTHTTLNQVLSIAHTDAGFIMRLDENGRTHLLAHSGLGEGLAARLEELEVSDAESESPMRAIDSMVALYSLGRGVKSVLAAAGYTSHIIAPITASSVPLGLLVVMNPAPDAYASCSVDAMAQIGKQVGMALENARLYELSRARAEALARRSRQLNAILKTTERVVLEEDLDATLRTVVSGLVAALDEVDGVVLWLWDQDARLLRPAALEAPPTVKEILALLPGGGLRAGEGLASRVFATGQLMTEAGISYLRQRLNRASPQVRPLLERLIAEAKGMSRISAPLAIGGEAIGCLDLLGLRSDMQLTEEDVPVMQTFANQVAAAIQKARLLQQISDQLEQLERSQEQLIASALLGATVELAKGLAHEVNNALTLVMTPTQIARNQELSPRLGFLLQNIESGGQRIQHLVQRFDEFAVPGERSVELGELNRAVEDVLQLLSYRFEDAEVRVSQKLDPNLPPVRGDMALLQKAITNVLINAVEAMPGGGRLEVRTWSQDEQVVLAVTDTGQGICEEHLDHLYEPGFTTKELRGLGLGLFATQNIVAAHAGEIKAESQVGVGSTFTIRLPAAVQGGGEAEEQGS